MLGLIRLQVDVFLIKGSNSLRYNGNLVKEKLGNQLGNLNNFWEK